MASSFFTTKKDSVLATASTHFATKITATPTAFNLTAPQASAYSALNSAFQTAYGVATDPVTRTKSAIVAKNNARIPLVAMASNLAKLINGSPAVTDAQKTDLGISVRKTPGPVGDPGTPEKFAFTVNGDGSLTLSWKRNNPRGATGVMYQVFRRATPTGEFIYMGGTGEKKFVDMTIPAGTSSLTYKVQAVRSSSVGAWATFNVMLSVGGVGSENEDTTALKIAA